MNDFRLSTLKPHYQQLFDTCQIRSSWFPQITATADKIVSLRSRYAIVEVQTTVPWWFIGILHYRESTFNFNTHLHNGDPLTNRTFHEPPGRPASPPANGQYYTWEESSIDALRWKTYDTAQDRSIAAWLWRFELWNGFGYAMRGLNSEYLWNGTNHFGSGIHQGKFVADGRFDATAKSQQVGAVALLWYLYHKGMLDSSLQGSVPTVNTANQHGTTSAIAQGITTQTLTQPTQAVQLLDVFRYYQRLPHQDAAIAWLQQQQSPSVLAEFSQRWRNGSTSGVTTSTVQTTAVTQQVVAPVSVPLPVQPAPVATVAPPAPPKPQPRTLAERLIAYSEDKGYQIDREPGYKNIIYVEGMYPDGRFNDDALNVWNDSRFVIEFKNGVPEIIGAWEATTEPGRYYTMHPCNINGAARITFGQHKAWQVGTHKDHEALVQTGGAITVYRDLNKDGMRTGDRTQTGHFGVNQHWGGDSPTSDIGRWSAGCLVGRTREGHRQFMSIIKQDPRYLKNRGYVFQTIVIDGSDLLKCYPPGGQPAAQSQPSVTPAQSTPLQLASPSGGQGGGIILKVLNDTVFKTSTQQSHLLPNSDKLLVKAGTQYQLIEDDPAEGNHAKIVLANSSFDPYGRNTWYVFKGHIEIEGSEPDNSPNESEDPNTIKITPVKTGPFQLPGYNSTFYLSDPVISGGHFSWAEATKNGTRIPVDKTVVEGIIKIAHVMEEVREYFDNRPITVNSWYRDPASNRRAGGASRSRHLVGDAVDFVVQGIAPPDANRRLESWWGSRGGLASASCFTHIDARGYRARWSYGF